MKARPFAKLRFSGQSVTPRIGPGEACTPVPLVISFVQGSQASKALWADGD